jgi:tRNA(Ile)-lysidine synthase
MTDFRSALCALPEGSVLAAVSGGADSVAMLHMLIEYGREVAVAHYNHGLRVNAEGDEVFVCAMCRKLGVPFVSGRGDVFSVSGGKALEETARKLRYAFLERERAKRGLQWIATAHNADDNTETVLMNLTRGTGLSGLCGIPYQRGRIIRPLLRLSKDDILKYLRERDIPNRNDESNLDTAFRRNYMRHEIVPYLRNVNPALTDSITRLTDSLKEDETYLSNIALEEIRQHDDGYPAKRLLGLPKPIASRVCRLLYKKISPYPPERVHIDAMLDVAAGGNGRQRCLSGNLTVEKRNGNIYIITTNDGRGAR